ncbi:Pycsar system effector family protein [Promicromonospora sp. NPDC023805]|uniref:Pycsar system effector family protein n=1 Tax=Promicromonospora sp. NPDC023805 TaxID=3154696 RepID=UPI00340E933D
MLQEARDEVISADQKASVILAVLGLGFGAALSGLVAGEWHPDELAPWSQAMWWSGLAAGALAVYFAGSAVWPRYTSADVNDGVHYWGHAARFTTLTALNEALTAQRIDHVARTRHQLWRLSHVVARKFRRIRLAMGFAVAGAILALASTVSG